MGDDGPARLRPAQRRLLSLLLLERDGELGREVLVDRMWGDAPPRTAGKALNVHVAGLRRAVPGLIRTTDHGYRVALDGHGYDRAEFDDLADQAFRAARLDNWPAVMRAAAEALRRWRGVPFHELADDEFAAPEISRLTERWLSLLELRVRALTASGRNDEAIDQLRELVLSHPLREQLWQQLMLALVRSGRSAEALRAYHEARRILARELDVEPGRTLRELQEAILAADPALEDLGHDALPTNLPTYTTSFVGREAEVTGLADLLAREQAVTVVGGPGFGKTRLAVETARAVSERHPGGVWMVSLAAARSRFEVIDAVAATAGARRQLTRLDELIKRLGATPTLLILDNCEHQRQVCAELIEAIRAAGVELTVLATSRQPLGFQGERLWRLDPLTAAGDVEPAPVTAASVSPAVRLFADRARAADPAFRLTERTAPAVAELCRRASGIPLALELAARWVSALGLDEIGEMMASEPPGAPAHELGHHRSVTAALEWSMALLAPDDRRLFIASSVFNGRFGLADARAVCAPQQEPRSLARAVARLAEASLIVVDRQPDGSALYRMLTPIREFAHQQLEVGGDWPATRDRLVSRYLGKVYGDSGDPLQQVIDLERVDRDLDNLRQSFHLGLELGRADEVARQLVSLDGYFLNRYLIAEGQLWLEQALPLIVDPLTRGHALRSLGSGAQVMSRFDDSLGYFRQALTILRRESDVAGLTQCLLSLAGLLAMRGDWADGIAAAEEARQLAASVESTSGLAVAAYYISENLAYSGNVEPALGELEEATRLFLAADETGRAAYSQSTLATVAALSGERDRALHAAGRALALADASGSAYRRVRALGAAAVAQALYGDRSAASTMLAEAFRLMRPYELDDIFQFLLPAALMIRDLGNASLLAEVLAVAQGEITRRELGCPVPWRAAMDDLWRSLPPAGVGDGSMLRPTRLVEQVQQDVLAALERMAMSSNTSEPTSRPSHAAG